MTDSGTDNELVDQYYAIRRLLARGGMSDIYEAEHTITKRRVVIKVLPTEKKHHEEFRARLLREAQFLEMARGEGVVEILGAGECAKFGIYIVMEHLIGRPLDGLIVARGCLRPEEVMRIFIPLATTLARLHEISFVHRDIKPANIFVALNSGSGKYAVKLLDFGVSSLSKKQQEPTRKLTFAGELLGTVEYMAPEQVHTRHDQIDSRSDIFAFGVSLFETLTGALPLGNDAMARFKSVHLASVAPELITLVHNINPELSKLVAKMLAYQREDRPQTLREVIVALQGSAAPIAIPSLGGPKETPPLSPVLAPTGAEQRRNARAAYITPVRLILNGESQDCRSEDVSEGGILLITKAKRPAGEIVQIKFSLPISGQMVQLNAVVRWQKENNGRVALGLEWIDPSSELQKELAEYIRFMRTPTHGGS